MYVHFKAPPHGRSLAKGPQLIYGMSLIWIRIRWVIELRKYGKIIKKKHNCQI